MTLKLRSIALGIVVVGGLMQTVQPDRSNPEERAPLSAPPGVISVLQRACYDCHSNTTNWPWYSYIAPASWITARHVDEGRKHLNFSDWNAWDVAKQKHASSEILEVLESGDMPLSSYLLLHRNAELSKEDKQLIQEWASRLVEGGE